MNMRTTMATRSIFCVLSAILLAGLVAPGAGAAVTVEIGDYRELALEFVKQKYDLSDQAALRLLRETEMAHGDRVINSVDVPDGAVLDFVRVDGQADDPDCAVTFEGSGVFRQAPARLMGSAISSALDEAAPAQRRHLMENIQSATDRGWFIQEITPEQRRNLLDYRLPGDQGVMRPAQTRSVRILVVLNNFPHWEDRAPTRSSYDSRGDWRFGPRDHPITEDLDLYTPGGALSTSDYMPQGLTNWNHVGISPIGSGAGTANHPRIDYRINGRPGTSVDLRERWFAFLFNQDNPNSVTNYYWANSNGNLRIQGNRSDVRGPLETKHALDRVPYGGEGYSYAIQPGTPIIERVPEPSPPPYGVPNLRGISADAGENIIGTLGYSGPAVISSVQIWDDDDGWEALDIDARRPDEFDSRRYVVETDGFDSDDRLRVRIGGQYVSVTPNAGWSLRRSNQGAQSRTTLTSADVLGPEEGNQLLSMCYYTHDHLARNRHMGSRPYQLQHLLNTAGRVDDICGTVDHADYRMRRPFPYDHDITDHAAPNMGFFERPGSTGTHNYGVWLSHLSNLMAENGISMAGYNSVIRLYPSDTEAGPDQGGTSGPWSGPHVFIPNSAVVMPESAGLVLTAHELGHALMGWPDLYDLDFYDNARGHTPPKFVSNMMGPYSVMARAGGVRVDAFLKSMSGWATPIALVEDMVGAEIPEIEGMRQDPVVYKLPGRPHYIAEGWDPGDWQEYFLVSNRNRTGADYFGDPSPRGLYIYHVDLRFTQRSEDHPMVIVEQADGLYELQRNPEGQVGDLEGDPFPGSHDVRSFTQYTNPSSNSYGFKSGMMAPNMMRPAAQEPPAPSDGFLVEGTRTDSFTRVVNISDPGSMMTADLYVVPREVIVTRVPVPGLDDLDPSETPIVQQGTEDFLIQHLNFNNDGNPPNFSMGDVQIETLRIDESGSSQRDDDVTRVSLFHDTDGDGQFDPDVDTRIATTTLQNGVAYFRNLNYRVPLNEQRDLFVTYDISLTANPARGNSVGAGIETHDYVRPRVPGTAQERRRTPMTANSAGLAEHRFPIMSRVVNIMEDPDTLFVTPISRAPVNGIAPPEENGNEVAGQAIEPGDQDVPMLTLELEVDQDRVIISRIDVDQTGTVDGVAHISSAKLFHDLNGDGQVDPGDPLLAETTFAMQGPIGDRVQRASFDVGANPINVTEGRVTSLLLTASFAETLPLAEPPLTVQYTLQEPGYFTLFQHSTDPQYQDIVYNEDDRFPMSSDIVSTPLPDEPPAPPEILSVEVIADGSILLSWDLSADDPNVGGEEDVVHYNVYRSPDRQDFLTVTPGDAIASVPAGETSFNDTTAPLGTGVFYMMRAEDAAGQESENSNVIDEPVAAEDNVPPVFSEFAPAQGADGVPRDTTIAFTITDNASGVDQNTLVFEIDDGEEVIDVADAPETTISGTPRQLRVEYTPPEEFEFEQVIQIALQVEDNAGNVSDRIIYSFTVTGPPLHMISGVITDADGNPEVGVEVSIDAQNISAMTDESGEYEIDGLPAGTHTVLPRKEGRSFQPMQRLVTVPPDAVAIDFTSSPGFSISGVVLTEDDEPLPGVTVTDGTTVATTNAAGEWEFTNVPAGTYEIIPMLDGWTFEPAEISVSVSTAEGDSTGNQFVATVETFRITGTIRTLEGNRLAGIEVQALQNDAVVATATTNDTGVYGLSNLEPGVYVIRPVDENFAFDPEQRERDLTTDTADVDFTAAPIYSMNLRAGLQMISVPVEALRTAPQDVFGADVPVARWDPQAGEYVRAPSDQPLMAVRPGAGFWTNAPQARQIEIPGTLFPSTRDLSLSAQRTWNMFGNPYDRDLPWEQVGVTAAASPYGFLYDAQANTYRLVSTAPGLGAVTVLPRNAGFWLRSTTATQVNITAPGAAPASAEVAQQAARRPADDAWIIPIVARAAGALDASNYAGVLPQAAETPAAYQMDNPPAVGPFVDLYFLGDGGRRLAVDVRENRPIHTWQFEVATDIPDARVEIQMPDLSEVPAGKSIYLVDQTAGKRMYARTLTTYSYDSGDGGTRRFSLEVADRTDAGLMITAASARATGGAVTVSYTLSAEAQVRVEVLNIAGRTIATLANGESVPAGLSTSGWNGRNSSGALVPAGRYLVRVNARAEDGQQVQALVPVQLQR